MALVYDCCLGRVGSLATESKHSRRESSYSDAFKECIWFNFDGTGKYGQYCQYSMDEVDNTVQKMEDRRGRRGSIYALFRGTTGTTAKVTIGNNGETRRGDG
jgi:hypothetical protein